jgi:drug/metabolite transporter (DMT)-like permease
MSGQTAESQRWRAIAALVFGACVIGFSGMLVRLTQTGPVAAGFWRLAFALPALALITRRATGPLGRPSKIALIAGLMFAGDLAFWHEGIKFTSIANATVLSNLTPVVVTAFAWIFLKQRPRTLFLLAVAVALGGVWMMAVGRSGGHLVNQPLGDLFSISTALWYALYFLAISEGRKTEGASRLMFWSGMVGAPLLLIASVLLREQIAPPTLAGWAACAALGLVHVCGQGSIAWGLGRLPTSTASVVVLVQPVVAGWLGWVLFGEALGPLQTAGAAVALSGVVLAQWASRPRPAATA